MKKASQKSPESSRKIELDSTGIECYYVLVSGPAVSCRLELHVSAGDGDGRDPMPCVGCEDPWCKEDDVEDKMDLYLRYLPTSKREYCPF